MFINVLLNVIVLSKIIKPFFFTMETLSLKVLNSNNLENQKNEIIVFVISKR